MTAGEQLASLAGTTGAAAALLLAIGAGATTGAALVDYSGLSSATAAQHLLAAHAGDTPIPTARRHSRKAVEIWRRRRDEDALMISGLL